MMPTTVDVSGGPAGLLAGTKGLLGCGTFSLKQEKQGKPGRAGHPAGRESAQTQCVDRLVGLAAGFEPGAQH